MSAASAVQQGFDSGNAARQIRSAHSTPRIPDHSNPGFDDGEFLIDTSVTLMSAPYGQYLSAVAFDGTNFLVVWEDFRGNSLDIYGARVTPQGTLLDRAGFVISQAPADQYWPAVGFDGTDFLVVWEDHNSSDSIDVYGARVTPQGEILDSAAIVITQAAGNQRFPALAFDGSNFLVVWEDNRSGSDDDIFGARVTPRGDFLDTAGIVISQAADYHGSPALAFDGSNFLVAWEDNRSGSDFDIYFTRVTPQGEVLDSTSYEIGRAHV